MHAYKDNAKDNGQWIRTMEIGRRGSEHINCVSCKIAYNIFDAEHNKLSSHTVTTSNQRRYSRFV